MDIKKRSSIDATILALDAVNRGDFFNISMAICIYLRKYCRYNVVTRCFILDERLMHDFADEAALAAIKHFGSGFSDTEIQEILKENK